MHRGSITAILNTEENNVRLMVFAIKAGEYTITYTVDAENAHRLGFKVDEGMTIVHMDSVDEGVARALGPLGRPGAGHAHRRGGEAREHLAVTPRPGQQRIGPLGHILKETDGSARGATKA